MEPGDELAERDPAPAVTLRPATAADAAAVLEIYRPSIEGSAVSFEVSTPSVDEMAARIAKSLDRWQWLVAESRDRILGYAYGTEHRARAAYRWSTEVSAYVHPDGRRQGIGRALYLRLFDDLAARGYSNAYAGIVLPNEPSVALHLSVGFAPIGVFHRVGRKLGRWHDVAWFERRLREAPPEEP
ncbi:MAG: N-acetyltransferase [Acidobacteria bacterium]|nr:N-acetyltransferase [Acidobacteriota bacterium]